MPSRRALPLQLVLGGVILRRLIGTVAALLACLGLVAGAVGGSAGASSVSTSGLIAFVMGKVSDPTRGTSTSSNLTGVACAS
jgi:hypothetical protein